MVPVRNLNVGTPRRTIVKTLCIKSWGRWKNHSRRKKEDLEQLKNWTESSQGKWNSDNKECIKEEEEIAFIISACNGYLMDFFSPLISLCQHRKKNKNETKWLWWQPFYSCCQAQLIRSMDSFSKMFGTGFVLPLAVIRKWLMADNFCVYLCGVYTGGCVSMNTLSLLFPILPCWLIFFFPFLKLLEKSPIAINRPTFFKHNADLIVFKDLSILSHHSVPFSHFCLCISFALLLKCI